MRRQSRIVASLLVLTCANSGVWASNRKFNILDDLLAFPQYRLQFPDSFVVDSQARAFLDQAPHSSSSVDDKRDAHDQSPLHDETHDSTQGGTEEAKVVLSYEELILEGQRYLCQIPVVEAGNDNRTKEEVNEDEERKELARATDRGLELLRGMESRCLYYISGWWSYSFCYMNQIKQFHALSSGGGVPNYPPMEDPTTHSFVLGRFPREDVQEDGKSDVKPGAPTDLAELKSQGGSRYLVQHLDGGDQCDLTGKNRRIEVQFHCNPHSTDRIAWIKELTTCSYLMLIYTPRLCNDVAFLPPPQDDVHTIECREILSPEEVFDWQAMHEYRLSQKLVESAETPEYPIIGGIEVGAQRLVGTEGRVIEKGRIASIGEPKVEDVAKSVNGKVQLLVPDLKKYQLDAEKLEALKKQLDKWAEGNDWILESVTPLGERPILQGVLAKDRKGEEQMGGTEQVNVQGEKAAPKGIEGKPADQQEGKAPDRRVEKGEERPDEEETGSEETFKDEL